MIDCWSQCFLCALPIRYDNYTWCSHACKYCFVQRKSDISEIWIRWWLKELEEFIKWKRSKATERCNRKIPIHRWWISDPFQPIEKKVGITKKSLELFAKTQYPFVVSTKWKLLWDDEYIELLSKCNCVVQVSLVSPQFDRIEPWVPPFHERLEIIRKVAPRVKRVIVRCQPYMPQVKEDIIKQIPMYKEAWVYWVIFEWMKFVHKVPWMIKLWWDYVIPKKKLEQDFIKIRDVCHKNGIKFYSWENRLRSMWDDLCCCWIDWLEWFQPNTYNLNYYLFDKEKYKPTESMKKKWSWMCFLKICQNATWYDALKKLSFQDCMEACTRDKWKMNVFLWD